MLKLAHLAGEILAHIFRHTCSSHAVILAWKCGDRALNAKIARHVDIIILEDKKRFSTSRWPKMLTELHNLRILRIHRAGHLAPVEILSSEVSKLSNTLIELEIRCVDALGAIFTFESENDFQAVHNCQDFMLSDQNCWNIGMRFPNMRKLVLQAPICEHDTEGSSRPYLLADFHQFSAFCQVLPSTIEHIDLNAILAEADLELIPASLTHIGATGWDFGQSLPAQLEHLDVCLQSLPLVWNLPNLKNLYLRRTYETSLYDTCIEDLRIELSLGLPAVLQTDWWPKNLQKLHIPVIATTSFLRSLPRCLDELSVSSIDWTDFVVYLHLAEDRQIALKSIWPHRLRILSVAMGMHSRPKILEYLPSTLEVCERMTIGRDINAELKSPLSSGKWTYLPSIHTMQLSCGYLTFPKGIPSSLTKLEVTIWTESAMKIDFSSTNIRTLGLQLQSHKMHSPVMRLQPHHRKLRFLLSNLVSNLPKKLERLHIHFDAGDDGFDWTSSDAWSMLPPTLVKLHITRSDPLQNHFEPWRLSGEQILPFLPKHITDLNVTLNDLQALELLSMPCRDNLNVFTMNYAQGCGLFSIESDDLFKTAWPPNAVSKPGTYWLDSNKRLFFDQRKYDLEERCKLYPDPRTIIPCSALR